MVARKGHGGYTGCKAGEAQQTEQQSRPEYMDAYMENGGEIMNYTYMVRCRDGSLYTGWTTDIEKRVKAHNEGKGAKYTHSRRPVRLAYYEAFETKEEAMQREYAIKHMNKAAKEKLVKENGNKKM